MWANNGSFSEHTWWFFPAKAPTAASGAVLPDSGALCTPQVTVVALPEQPAAHVPGTPPHPAKEQGVAGACCPT